MPRPRWLAAAARRWPVLWPAVPAAACYATATALRWQQQHGAPGSAEVADRMMTVFGFAVVGWGYLLIAAALLRLTRLRRGRRYALANVFPVALYGGLSLTPSSGGLITFNLADVAFLVPAVFAAQLAPAPTFTSACSVSYWALGSRGFRPSVDRAVELGDGGVLLVARASREGDEASRPKLARVAPDDAPDTTFALDRGCPAADDVIAGPGGAFAYTWQAEAAAAGRMAVTVAWHDAHGRPLARPPFPAESAAVPPWSDGVLARATPGGGFTFAGDIPSTADTASPGYGVVRVLADGRYDPAFAPWPLPPPVPLYSCRPADSTCTPASVPRMRLEIRGVRAWPDGSLLVLVNDDRLGDSTRLVRLGPGGRPDTAFARRARAALAGYGPPRAVALDAAGRPVLALHAASYADDSAGRPRPAAAVRSVVRLLPDGSLDPSFQADSLRFGWPRGVYPQPSGHLIVYLGGEFAYGLPPIVRVDAAGRVDSAFQARVAPLTRGAPQLLLVRRDGTLLVEVGGELALLTPEGRPLRRVR